jgi:regulatory protein
MHNQTAILQPPEASYKLALRRLNRSAMTCQQMREYLLKRDVESVDVERVIEYLIACGFLNDYSYAESYIRSAREYKRVGPQYLRMQLKKRGIPIFIIEELVHDQSDDFNRAMLLAQKKLKSTQTLDSQKRWLRITGYLARKGHNSATIMQVMGELRRIESE